MDKKYTSLRKQFLMRILLVLFVIAILSSGLQLYLMEKQIDKEIDTKSNMISESINQGIKETELASQTIEHQIDLKMVGYAKHIGDLLNKESQEDITTEELYQIKEKLGLSGLSIFTRQGDDIVAVKSTDQKDIGFSTKNFGEFIYKASNDLLEGKKPVIEAAYTDTNLLVLPIVQSGSHDDKPLFFKYAYYHPPGADYFINPFIEAGEVNKFTKEVGPEQWIKQMEEEVSYLKEITVLNPAVFKNPKLEEQLYPPLTKVVFGDYKYKTKKDIEILKQMAGNPVEITSIQTVDGKKMFKMFLPTGSGHAIYVALDYREIVYPLYRHSLILIISGLVGLLALTLLTITFFNRIYENIQKIIFQIKCLEEGDLTVKSKVNDGSELDTLSKTTNRMVEKLNQLVTDTQEQAKKTQRLSMILEMETAQSLDKMYAVSTEATMKSREQLYEITEFLNDVLNALEPTKENSSVIENVERMKKVATDRTAAVTNATITLSDLMQSLHEQSSELSAISNILLERISKFKL